MKHSRSRPGKLRISVINDFDTGLQVTLKGYLKRAVQGGIVIFLIPTRSEGRIPLYTDTECSVCSDDGGVIMAAI